MELMKRLLKEEEGQAVNRIRSDCGHALHRCDRPGWGRGH